MSAIIRGVRPAFHLPGRRTQSLDTVSVLTLTPTLVPTVPTLSPPPPTVMTLSDGSVMRISIRPAYHPRLHVRNDDPESDTELVSHSTFEYDMDLNTDLDTDLDTDLNTDLTESKTSNVLDTLETEYWTTIRPSHPTGPVTTDECCVCREFMQADDQVLFRCRHRICGLDYFIMNRMHHQNCPLCREPVQIDTKTFTGEFQ